MDKKARSILTRTYWNGKGWIDRKDGTLDPADFAYAKAHGAMFDPVSLTHDESIAAIRDALAGIEPHAVARAFLSSLSTRRLEWRSALASHASAQALATPHAYVPKATGHAYANGVVTHTSYRCGICNGAPAYRDEDLSVLNFERVKWGGVRIGERIYTLLDLQQFPREAIPEPTRDDVGILEAILSTVADSAPGDHPGALADRLAPVVKSSKNERRALMEILACAGILRARSTDRPSRGKHDWRFMADWRGEDRYDEAAVRHYFGRYLA